MWLLIFLIFTCRLAAYQLRARPRRVRVVVQVRR